MDQTVQNRLTTLAETYKQKKLRLTKPQIEEAASLLAQLWIGTIDDIPLVLENFVCHLPPDSTAKAIRDSWGGISEEIKDLLQKGILDLSRSERFDRLKLVAAAAVADVDPQRGVAFLCSACASLDSRSGSHLSPDALKVFRKTFLDEDVCRLEKLDITTHPSFVTRGLLVFTFKSLFSSPSRSADTSPEFQLRIVKWIFRNQAYRHLDPVQRTQLIEAIKRWAPALQAEFHASLESLPPGFEFLLTPSTQETVKSSNRKPEMRPTPAEEVKLHWKDLLAELQKQLVDFERDLRVAQEQLVSSQEEDQKLKRASETNTKHIQSLEVELMQRSQKLERALDALNVANAAVAEGTRREKESDTQIAELKKKHQDEIALLNSRIETEAAHHLDTFKHNLARALRVDYTEFAINEGKPMTAELGQGLHHLLAAIFAHLQKNGINAKS